MKASLSIVLVVIVSGCATSQHYVKYQEGRESKEPDCAIDFYTQNLELNRKTQVIGEIRIADTGFSTNCDAESVMKTIKAKACEEGADAIQLFDVRHPSWSDSTCFQASARLLIYQE